MSIYDPLGDFLREKDGGEWRASFSEIEGILGRLLPKSAREYQAWWANEQSPLQSQKIAWTNAGWITDNLNLTAETVTFVRSSKSPTVRSVKQRHTKKMEQFGNLKDQKFPMVAGIDPAVVFDDLLKERPVFHSEADFQHALAWSIHRVYPDAKIRLEYRPPSFGRHYVDLWVVNQGQVIAVELKYWTRKLELSVSGEEFFLQEQGAQDTSRYDLLKDIQRLEKVATSVPNCTGWAIALTNDSSYWRTARTDTTVDAMFRLHEGRELSGILDWAEHTGEGTKNGREEPLSLGGDYSISWWRYSEPSDDRNGQFCGLMFTVEP